MEMQLYSLGEIIDKLEHGKVAISLGPVDTGVMIAVDEENDLFYINAGSNRPRYGFEFKKHSDNKVRAKRWIITNESSIYPIEKEI